MLEKEKLGCIYREYTLHRTMGNLVKMVLHSDNQKYSISWLIYTPAIESLNQSGECMIWCTGDYWLNEQGRQSWFSWQYGSPIEQWSFTMSCIHPRKKKMKQCVYTEQFSLSLNIGYTMEEQTSCTLTVTPQDGLKLQTAVWPCKHKPSWLFSREGILAPLPLPYSPTVMPQHVKQWCIKVIKI